MQDDYNNPTSKPPFFDKVVDRAVRQYKSLNEQQKALFQHRLLNDPIDTENVVSASPTTWEDIASILGPIQWAWPRWLAKGFLTIIAGESGIGKSILALCICASYWKGEDWLNGTPFDGEKGCILWCEAEASQALNLERASQWELPIGRIYIPLSELLDDVILEQHELRSAIIEAAKRPEAKLSVIDSFCVSNRGNEDASDMIEGVFLLAHYARNTNKPILLFHHLRKPTLFDSEEVTLDRLRGSSAIARLARLFWGPDKPDPNAKDEIRLSVIKSNLARFPDPLGIKIDESGVHFGEAPEPTKTGIRTEKAVDLLLSLREIGPLYAEECEQADDESRRHYE